MHATPPTTAVSWLNRIHSPDDVKSIPEPDLPALAQEVRDLLISVLSNTGGHLGPNLGVVELTIALHRVFSTPDDKILFDVSHQGYVHKLFTGRRERFSTIRQYEGLNGFLLRTESPHDCYGAGHAGTALSAALGIAKARDLRGSNEHVIAVAGDAAFTCGVSYEALNNIADTTKRLIVILNDNEWSIAKNVGAIASYLNRITTSPTFAHIRQQTGRFVERVAGRGAIELAHRIEEGVKNLLWPSVIFEEFGLRYFGPLDGHDIPLLLRTLEFLKTQDQPVLLHILTQKGRGYAPALAKPDKFHGLGKFQAETGETIPAGSPTYSELLGESLANMADHDEKVLAITAAMPSGTGLGLFRERHPDRYFDVGIAEEHAALFACGLCTQGFKPFLAIYSTFMQRAYDMLVHDAALQNLNLAICMDRAGLSGDDGGTHHGLFDIGFLRHIPNFVIMQPKDEAEFVRMLETMRQYASGPIAIRYPRGIGSGVAAPDNVTPLEIGKAELLRDGADVAIFGLGPMHEIALEAADLLAAKGVSAAVINPRWIKPLDTVLIDEMAATRKLLCTIEDHSVNNGFGSAVLEHLSTNPAAPPLVRIGWPDQFIEHGTVPILRKKHGLTAEAVSERVLKTLR